MFNFVAELNFFVIYHTHKDLILKGKEVKKNSKIKIFVKVCNLLYLCDAQVAYPDFDRRLYLHAQQLAIITSLW